jgi:hypothetical protein
MGAGLRLNTPEDAIADDELTIADGCRFEEQGAVRSERGRKEIREQTTVGTADTLEHKGILGLFTGHLKDANGIERFYTIYKRDDLIYADDLQIDSGWDTDTHLSGVVFRGWAYLTDGRYFKKWQPVLGLQAVGLDAPDLATAGTNVSSEGSNGFSILNNVVTWKITFYNGVAESNFSDGLEHTFAASLKTAELASIPTGPAGTTERRIYRTLGNNGSALFKVGTIADNTTTTFSDPMGLKFNGDDTLDPETDEANITDEDITDEQRRIDRLVQLTGKKEKKLFGRDGELKDKYEGIDILLGQIIQTNLGIMGNWTDHDKPASGGTDTVRSLRIHQNIVYGIKNNNTLAWTRAGGPEYWSPFNELEIGAQDGERLYAVEALEDDIMCYTDQGVWKYETAGGNAFRSRLTRIDSPVGIVGPHAITPFYLNGEIAGHAFVAKDGVYSNNGKSVQKLSEPVRDLWEDNGHRHRINEFRQDKIVAGARADRLFFSYSRDDIAPNDRTLVLDLQTGVPKWSVSTLGYMAMNYDKKNRLLGSTDDGKIYAIDEADNNNPVRWQVGTKLYPMQGAMIEHKPERLVIDADFQGLQTYIWVQSEHGPLFAKVINTEVGRKKYRFLIPFAGGHDRTGAIVRSTGAGDRALFTVGFEYDDGEVS